MANETKVASINVPVAIVTPVKLARDAAPESCGLFFSHLGNLPLGLVVDWDGATHLIHLSGPHLFEHGTIDIRDSIRGLVIQDIDYEVDVTSRYDAINTFNPPGALIMKSGELFLSSELLGDQFHSGTQKIPLGRECISGGAVEACGFMRWSITVQDGDKRRVIQSFEAISKT
jgi:hypothetical protein